MQIDLTREELYSMIKNAVREVIKEEEVSHFIHSLQEVSDEEMNDVTETYGSPDQYKDVARSETIDL